MKKIFFALPCIAAVAIATFVGTKVLGSNACEHSGLLMENVEAVSLNEQGTITIHTCYTEEARLGPYTWKCGPSTFPTVDPCSEMAHMKIDDQTKKKRTCYVPND